MGLEGGHLISVLPEHPAQPRRQQALTRVGGGALDLKERLLERGVLIRSCANYHGLGPDYYRVCVRLESDNQRLLAGGGQRSDRSPAAGRGLRSFW